MGSVREAFLAALPPEQLPPWRSFAPLEEALARAHAASAARWPGIAVAPEPFAAHLGARAAPSPPDGGEPFPHAGEQYLQRAILDGAEPAIAAFERAYVPAIARAVARFRLSSDELDELTQSLREQLLMPHGGRPPRIGDWSGRGELGAWLRVASVRAAIKLERPRAGAPGGDEALDQLAGPAPSPELRVISAEGRAAFRAALGEAIRSLAPEEQNVLRQHHLDELTLDQLAALHRVHRTTVAYWIERARDRLWKRTRKALAARARLTSSDCDSLFRHAQSQFAITLRSLFDE